MLGGAGAVGLVCALLLVRSPGAGPEDTREALRALMNDASPAGGLVLRGSRATDAPATCRPCGPCRGVGSPRPGRRRLLPRRLDLSATARLCAELARVGDASELPRLLARAALILDASGLIVWVADRGSTSLFPMLAQGYTADRSGADGEHRPRRRQRRSRRVPPG